MGKNTYTHTHTHTHTHTRTHTHIKQNRFAVPQKRTQHCKLAVLQKKRKSNDEK